MAGRTSRKRVARGPTRVFFADSGSDAIDSVAIDSNEPGSRPMRQSNAG